jgi:hypothetical protein
MDDEAIDGVAEVDASPAGAMDPCLSAGIDACRGAVLVARVRDFATGLNTRPPFSVPASEHPPAGNYRTLRTDARSHRSSKPNSNIM